MTQTSTPGSKPAPLQYLPLADLKPYPGNPRLNEKAIGPVAASIKSFGFQQPIVVDKDNVIIVGHTRFEAAKTLGMTEVPVIVAHNLTPEQVQAYRLADNRTNQNADWDWSLLGEELRGLMDADFDLSLTAFDQEEIKKALHFDDGTHIRDYTPRDKPDALTQPGETWTSMDGEHVIHCGLNNSAEAQTLLKKNPIDCIWTDPPYNLGLSGVGGKVHNDTFASDKDFTEFLKKCFAPAVEALPKGHFVFTCGVHGSYVPNRDALVALGLELKNQLIWVKPPSYTMNSTFSKSHECIWLFQKPGASRHVADGNPPTEDNDNLLIPYEHLEKKSKGDLLEYVKALTASMDVQRTTREHDKFADHPTVKPSSLISQHIKRTTFPGDRVCDLFGGSGSTALTCFRLGRKSLTFELDANYVDVTLTRLYEHHEVDFMNEQGEKWSDRWLPVREQRLDGEKEDE